MLEITVKTLDSQNHSFTCEDDITVRGFKEHIADTVSVPVESQRLIYCGRVLQDDKKLNDYGNVNGKVIHLVQRAPPQPESRSSSSDNQRQNNNQGWPHSGSRVQYLGQLHRNAMYLGAMSMPAEVVEGLPAPQLSNTLSNSRLVVARRMLSKAIQLTHRLDDPSVPLHPSSTENNASEPPPQASAPEEEAESDSNVNSNESNLGSRIVQAASEIIAQFNRTALTIRLAQGNNEDEESAADESQPEQSAQTQESEPEGSTSERQRPERPESEMSETERSEAERPETERTEPERNDASTSNNTETLSGSRSTIQVPRPPQMAQLLASLVYAQNRLRPYIERYRTLMFSDPTLTPGDGPQSVAENQRIVDGVSESLHYLAHACHALSDIIVDMGQQPPRNLRCRPIIIQHSAILQAGIPIQVESPIHLSRNATNNNNATDEGNEATRPSSPTSAASDQTSRSNSANNRSAPRNRHDQSTLTSVLGAAIVGGANDVYPISPTYTLIRNALRTALGERHSQMNTSSGTVINGTVINTPTNIPIVTIVGQQAMDLGTSNSGQSTQARSNIGTHPTTSTQTRSTARPHVLHPHAQTLNVGVGMGQNLDFDPFLPCNSHHVRRNQATAASATSTSQSNQANQSASSESHSRSQSASHTSSTSAGNLSQSQSVNFTVGSDSSIERDLFENDGQALATGIGLAMTLDEILQSPDSSGVHISFVGSRSNPSEIRLTPENDMPLSEFLAMAGMNVLLDDFTSRNFLIDFWMFLMRNMTFSGLMQLCTGQSTPLINLRRPLREFLEHSFPDASPATLQEQVVEQIISFNRPYLQTFVVPDEETASRRVDMPATIEALLRKFCMELLKLLFNNDLDDATFAQEAITLAKKLDNQSTAVLQYMLHGGQNTLETIISRFFNQLTAGLHPVLQQTVLAGLSERTRAYANSQMSQEDINSLLVFKDEPSASAAEHTAEKAKESQVKVESSQQEQNDQAQSHAQAQAQAQVNQQREQHTQEKTLQQQSIKQEVKEEAKEVKSEPMELDGKVVDECMDLANGEEIPETFPGAEDLPAEWVPIIARDSVRQRKQAQLQALQGGPIPFSDAYLSAMPSKRRKLIEQQKPQLLANPTANNTAIAASVERLVREGISHSQLEEAQGAASAVAQVPAVRRAFGQAIKDSLHPARLKTPDFPNAKRFPNASKYFGTSESSAEAKDGKDGKPTTATTK